MMDENEAGLVQAPPPPQQQAQAFMQPVYQPQQQPSQLTRQPSWQEQRQQAVGCVPVDMMQQRAYQAYQQQAQQPQPMMMPGSSQVSTTRRVSVVRLRV